MTWSRPNGTSTPWSRSSSIWSPNTSRRCRSGVRARWAQFVAILRIVPELERSGDLVEHIALGTPQGMAKMLTPRARGLVEQMGETGVDMWRQTANAYADRDASAAERLRRLDDWLDELHVNLSTELGQTLIDGRGHRDGSRCPISREVRGPCGQRMPPDKGPL